MMKLSLRPLLICSVLGLGAVGLGGCGGFTPLYAASGVTPKLAAIEVSRPDGRTGFVMGQYLDDELTRDPNQKPVYRLLLRTNEVRIPRGIRIDNVASRYEVDMNTSYTLVEIATRKVITQGVVKVNVTYDAADQPYAALAAAQDGQTRAAEQSAERIRLELATYFASPRPTPSAGALSTTEIATYSERLQPAAMQSPRERALGQPTVQSQANPLGQPLPTSAPDGENPNSGSFSPSQDPSAIKTLPDPNVPGQPAGQ